MNKPIRISLPLTALLLASPTWAQTHPQIAVSPSTLAFNGSSGNVSQQPLTISSTGNAPLVLQTLTFSNAVFSSSSTHLPMTIQPGQSLQIKVSAQPATNVVSAGLFFVSNSQYQRSVHLSETPQTATTTHQADLSWKAPASGASVSKYDIDRAQGGSTTYTNIASTAPSTLSWADNSVQAGQTYTYRVRSLNQDGDTSQPSNTVTLSIP